MSSILGQEGEDPQTYRNFYKAVVNANIMPGSETWVMTHRVGRNLGGFHHRLARQIENMQPRRDMMRRWVYPPLDKAMKTVGLKEVETYILNLHNTVA